MSFPAEFNLCRDKVGRLSSKPARLILLLTVQISASAAVAAATHVGSAPYRASATGAGNSHSPVFSADGKHVAFISHANNLVTNDDLGPHLDLFVRDLAASNTVLVSVSTNGFGGANDNIGLYTLSSNAQVIAFDTTASNLASGDTNRISDIYVRDLLAGATCLVSMNADGTGSANGPSSNPLISEDGRYVIFESLASNLVTNDFNGTNDIFIHDLLTGTTELVSMNADGMASADGPSHSPSISVDGQRIAFVSHGTNLIIGATNRLGEIYVRDVEGRSNLWASASQILATRFAPGAPGPGPYIASEPMVSENGRFVCFKTLGRTVWFDLGRPTNSIATEFTNGVLRFEDNPRLAVSAAETPLSFSADGRYLLFQTQSNLLQPGIMRVDFESLDTNIVQDRFNPVVYWTNVGPSAQLVLTNQVSNLGSTWTRMPWASVSRDAARLFFLADATNLVSGATNRVFQIYAFDLMSGLIELLSTKVADGQPRTDLDGVIPAISPDGSVIAWDSPDDHIVPDDLNRAWDVFVRNVDTGETQLISARHPDLPASSGLALSRLDLNPGAISANGQRIAVLSLDSTLAPDDTNNWRDLFVRDLVTGTNFDVSRSIGRVGFLLQTNFPGTNTAAAASLSADGRYVAFAGELPGTQSTNRTIYWRDLEVSSNRVVASGFSVSVPILSPDGQFLAFHSADSLVPSFPDGNNVQDVFVYQMTSPSPPFLPNYDGCMLPVDYVGGRIASRTPSGLAVGNGPSINPVFSPDSSWILFQSRATDLTGQTLPPQAQYQLYGRGVWSTNVPLPGCIGLFPGRGYSPTKLISYVTIASPALGGTSAELPLPGGAANPRFSADSRFVAFEGGTNSIFRHDLLAQDVLIVTQSVGTGVSLTNRARVTNDLVCSSCANPTLNVDGRLIAYESRPGSGGMTDVFLKNMESGQVELVSVSLSGTNGNGSSFTPLLSHDARFVVFASKASDLVPNDNNRATDIFVRDRFADVTHCLSRNFAGTGTGNQVSSNPILSADGRTVAFQSFASDIVPGDYNDTRDVFVVTLGGPDTDDDGMDDDWEMAYFSTLDRDGSGDFDHDGASDLDEFRAGTNPANDASILRVLTLTTSLAAGPNPRRTTVLLWSAIPGKTYRVQFKASLDAPWTTAGADVTAGSTSASLTDAVEALDEPNNPRRFYRVRLAQ
jgi:Tol biopolymer transport system component